MTGHGEATVTQGEVHAAVEIRTVNNRYLKVQVRTDGPAAWESAVETLVRESVRRGAMQVNIRIDREPSAEQYRLNTAVLNGYADQISAILFDRNPHQPPAEIPWGALLGLPGVVREPQTSNEADDLWPVVEAATKKALAALDKMRRDEGSAMAADMAQNCRVIAEEVTAIEQRAPIVVDAYRQRLEDRLNGWLESHQVHLQPGEIVKEIGIFADRADISEEIVRLRSHLEQFHATLAGKESNGRKLDFLVQEMFREVNTIGSKGNDVEISRRVVDMKTIIERIREMVQNVE